MVEFAALSKRRGGIVTHWGYHLVWTAQSQEHSVDQYQKNTVNFQVVTQNYIQDFTLESTGNY